MCDSLFNATDVLPSFYVAFSNAGNAFRTRELEVSLAAARSDVDSFCETLRTTNAEKERMSVKISDLELDLVRTKLVVDENQKNLLSTDGHTWWAYVWHECCKQKRIDHENGVVAINATTSVGPNEGDDQPNAVSLQHNVDTLRDQMKSLAIELASVRQVINDTHCFYPSCSDKCVFVSLYDG